MTSATLGQAARSMDDVSEKIIPLLQQLLPGFFAMMTFYWFASAPKPTQFERVIQALVLTAIISLMIGLLEKLFYFLGHFVSFGEWGAEHTTIYSIILATIMGCALAYASNRDIIFDKARRYKITKKASADDFIHILRQNSESKVIVNFKDDRRLCGAVKSYPNEISTGVIWIGNPRWMDDTKTYTNNQINSILINISDIKFIEFIEEVKDEQ